jgi:hypothetical protein
VSIETVKGGVVSDVPRQAGGRRNGCWQVHSRDRHSPNVSVIQQQTSASPHCQHLSLPEEVLCMLLSSSAGQICRVLQHVSRRST